MNRLSFFQNDTRIGGTMNRIRDGTVIQFPPKMAEQSLKRKLAIRAQSEGMLRWVDYMISVDRKIAEGAAELGITETEFRSHVHAALRRKGKL
jgi:hypothetical protein